MLPAENQLESVLLGQYLPGRLYNSILSIESCHLGDEGKAIPGGTVASQKRWYLERGFVFGDGLREPIYECSTRFTRLWARANYRE
ncbi:MAG: hypothetical protein ABSG53_14310 [Thermoguttaceae bacterium]|jgi:hypothetical protein